MTKTLFSMLLATTIMAVVYWLGYVEGAFNQKTLDAPAKARMISKIAELDEAGDPKAQVLLYTYLDTELSFYEEYLENGNPFIARLTQHEYFLEKDGEYLSEIAAFIHATNDGTNKYKQDVAERLERIGYMSPYNATEKMQ